MKYLIGDAAPTPHLILGHDQVLCDRLLLLLVFAQLLLNTTTTSAASFSLLSRRLTNQSLPEP